MQLLTPEQGLLQVGEQLIQNLNDSQATKRLRASGRSAASNRVEVTTEGKRHRLRMIGAFYWRFQQQGRGPGKYKWPSRKLVLAIEQWVKDKGVNIPAYPIAVKINRDGIQVPNRFNPGGVLSEPLNGVRVRGLLKTVMRPIYIQSAQSLLF